MVASLFIIVCPLELQSEQCCDEIKEYVDQEYGQRDDGPVQLQNDCQDDSNCRCGEEVQSDSVLTA